MKQLYFICSIIILLTILEVCVTSCANIIPPTGGPRDSLPPQLMSATPKDSSTSFINNKIVLTFNEFVEVKELEKNLIVSPLPKNNPQIDYKLKTVTIKLKDSLQPNTTYSINFGNALKDINEGNTLENFTYVFSTGNNLDSNTLSGKVILAETGLVDSTLIAALYLNTTDTAVLKQKPNYIASIRGNGTFNFKFLPAATYALYVLPNDYTKKYDDSSKLFAFHPTLININQNKESILLYAYEQEKKKITPTNNNNNNNKSNNKPQPLQFTTNLQAGKQSLLSQKLILQFNRKIQQFDSTKILLTDTTFKPFKNYTVKKDSLEKENIIITNEWKEGFAYQLIIQKNAFTDTANNNYPKNDTVKFEVKKQADYGSIKIRFNKLDTTKNPVLLIFQNNDLKEAIVITQKEFSRSLFNPGEYELKLLYDKNKNGIWDTGNYRLKLQPEIIKPLTKKLSVRANWDNEIEIEL